MKKTSQDTAETQKKRYERPTMEVLLLSSPQSLLVMSSPDYAITDGGTDDDGIWGD